MAKKKERSAHAHTDGAKMWALTNYGIVRGVAYRKRDCHDFGIALYRSADEYWNDYKRGVYDIRRVSVVDRP